MKKYLLFVCNIVLLGAPAIGYAGDLKVTSTAFKNGGTLGNAYIFDSFGCTGQNVSPALTWSGAPPETKYYALMVHDPDAPTGSGWWHWVMINIPSTVTNLPEKAGNTGASLPVDAMQTPTDFGKVGYGGPCPPPGKPHRYIFKVFALKDKIPVDERATAAMVGFYANQLKLAEGSITGYYGRK